jgi:L-2-hydroxycarboxylate dehydrogenase (NAD+)
MLIHVSQARMLAARILEDAGAPARHARMQADILIDGELRGHPSHGLLRLPRLVRRIRAGVLDPAAEGELSWTHGARLVVDGQQGFGPVVAHHALTAVSDRARSTGVAAAFIGNSNHLGMLASYAERIAAAGQVLIATTTTEALVHPWGGRRAMVGTNPIAIGVPTDGTPFVLDMATGATSVGKIHSYAAAGRSLEQGWAVDAEGQPTVDATAAAAGAITPFGGAKGYGLGIALEVLVAGLTGTALGRDIQGTLDDDRPSNKGDVFIVAEMPATARRLVAGYLDEVRDSARADAAVPVTVPGDRSAAHKAAAARDGLSIPDSLWAELRSLNGGRALSVDQRR